VVELLPQPRNWTSELDRGKKLGLLLVFFLTLTQILTQQDLVYADDSNSASQFHFRTGFVEAKVSGVVTNSFRLSLPIDMEYELFRSTRSSYTLRMMIGYDISGARIPYIYTGIGRRFYFSSTGMEVDESGSGMRVVSMPLWRYYFGGDIGLSQTTVTSFGTVLQSQSVGLDLGPNAGIIYQLTKSFGLEFQGGVNFALGFTTVSVNTFTYRALLGGTYFF